MNLPNCKKPCKDCPFRKDTLKGWLGEKRIKEILLQDSFVCHKENKLQCAGHMILNKDINSFVQVAKYLKYDLVLSGHELIFNTQKELIKHHKYITL